MPKSHKPRHGYYLPMLGVAFALGTVPALLNLTVDPYQMFSTKDRSSAINDIAEKAHYPLWKLAKFKRGMHDTIILGDSRARALRDKYWHELEIPKALNLAYGGGTIPEVYSTFSEIKSDPAIQNIIIGVQLRSFYEGHKGGMNRVPEAVELVRHKLEYLKNWNVFQTTLKVFEKENETNLQKYGSFVSQANASDLGRQGQTSLSKLLEPDVCFGCNLPEGVASVKPAKRSGKFNFTGSSHYEFGGGWNAQIPAYNWSDHEALYAVDYSPENLPAKFERQVRKNGSSDWRNFEFSQKYWGHFEEIGRWAKEQDKNLIFVIPPTITNMQKTIQAYGLGKLNHQLRAKLAKLGHVVDLDFPNQLTKNIDNFNDAYHFNSNVARQIVGQIVPLVTQDKKAIARAKKREKQILCQESKPIKSQRIFQQVHLLVGENCRIWGVQK